MSANGAGLGDDDTAVRMADQNHRTVLRGQRAFRDRDVIRQRIGRILNDRDGLAVLLEQVIDALPTGAVHEPPVHENDVLDTPYSFLSATSEPPTN